MSHISQIHWKLLLLALLLVSCVRPAPIPKTPAPTLVATKPLAPVETAVPLIRATAAAPTGLESWQTVTDPAYGYAFKLPPVLEVCGETPYSRQYCWPADPGGTGPLPSFYATFIPAGFTNPEGQAYNFLPDESVRSLLDLAVGDTLVIPPDADPVEFFTYSRLPDQPVGDWKAAVIENERVWEAPTEIKDRRALIVTDSGTLVLGSYYTTLEELNLYENILANFEFTPAPVAAATPEVQAASGQIYLPQVFRSGGRMEDRATADRPDDVSGYQVHVFYVLPSDGTDQGLDVDGTLAASLGSIQAWLLQQTGEQRLRMDMFEGTVDITFRRLSRTDAEIASHGTYVRDTIQAELQEAGFNNPQKLYAVYYDGTSDTACSGGAWPPDLVGNVAVLYLKGLAQSDFPCNLNSFAPYPEAPPGYPEFAMLQEIFHTLGATAVCAPHHSRQGQVSDGLTDLMYSGEESWVQRELDTGRDDYWGHGDPDCVDLAHSVFIDPLPEDPQLPPGW